MAKSLVIKVPTLLLAAAALYWLSGPVAWATAATIMVLGMGLLLLVVLHPNASLWARTVWRAPRSTDAVALTFDDGPDPEFTPKVLDILAERGLKAAFFVVGERIREHPELVARMHEAGHLVCNHTDSHSMRFHFGLWPTFRRELTACNRAIEEVIGQTPTLFRSPQGGKNPALGDVLGELDMTAIGWQVRGLDALRGDATRIEERIAKGAKPGGVILLHDGSGLGGSDDRSATIAALPRILDRLEARALRVVRLDELLELEPYRPVAT